MMKRVLTAATALLLTFAVGCNGDLENNYAGAYDDIMPGLSIYNSATTQQSVAMDPAAVAIRLAMLLDEAALQESTIEEVFVTAGLQQYRLKELLFGSGVVIEALTEGEGEQVVSTGDYRITYKNTPLAPIDRFNREGSYLVRTGGLSLLQTTESMAWEVVPEAPVRIYTGTDAGSRFLVAEGLTRLSASTTGTYKIELVKLRASFEDYKEFASEWSGVFYLSTSTVTGNLAFSNHDEDTFSLHGSAEGPTFFAFNERNATRMSYYVSNISPLNWRPHETPIHTIAVSGTEQAALTHAADYSQELYPSPTVQIKRSYADKVLDLYITYNGITKQL